MQVAQVACKFLDLIDLNKGIKDLGTDAWIKETKSIICSLCSNLTTKKKFALHAQEETLLEIRQYLEDLDSQEKLTLVNEFLGNQFNNTKNESQLLSFEDRKYPTKNSTFPYESESESESEDDKSQQNGGISQYGRESLPSVENPLSMKNPLEDQTVSLSSMKNPLEDQRGSLSSMKNPLEDQMGSAPSMENALKDQMGSLPSMGDMAITSSNAQDILLYYRKKIITTYKDEMVSSDIENIITALKACAMDYINSNKKKHLNFILEPIIERVAFINRLKRQESCINNMKLLMHFYFDSISNILTAAMSDKSTPPIVPDMISPITDSFLNKLYTMVNEYILVSPLLKDELLIVDDPSNKKSSKGFLNTLYNKELSDFSNTNKIIQAYTFEKFFKGELFKENDIKKWNKLYFESMGVNEFAKKQFQFIEKESRIRAKNTLNVNKTITGTTKTDFITKSPSPEKVGGSLPKSRKGSRYKTSKSMKNRRARNNTSLKIKWL